MKYKQQADGLNKRVGVRLTEYEYEVLKDLANKYCMTMSNYIRQMIRRKS